MDTYVTVTLLLVLSNLCLSLITAWFLPADFVLIPTDNFLLFAHRPSCQSTWMSPNVIYECRMNNAEAACADLVPFFENRST